MYQGEAILPNPCWSAVSDPGNTTGMRGVKKKRVGWGGRKDMEHEKRNGSSFLPSTIPHVTFLAIWGILLLKTKDSVSSPARSTVIIKYVPSAHIYACI